MEHGSETEKREEKDMTTQNLDWSAPATHGYASIEAGPDDAHWRITPVPRDVCRISFAGRDADGTIVSSLAYEPAHAESVDEAKIVIETIRAGSDHLPDWRDQLIAAGFSQSYPDSKPDDSLSTLWKDVRKSGLFQISVKDGYVHRQDRAAETETSVAATYESDGAQFWHNVCRVTAGSPLAKRISGTRSYRDGLPEGVDALKVGVAAAIAIRDARRMRGGSFAKPLGGAPKAKK
jgi:hypothetical protein